MLNEESEQLCSPNKKLGGFTFHLECNTLKISMCSPRFKPCTFQIQVQCVITICVECLVLDLGVYRGGPCSVSTVSGSIRPTPHALSGMYTFCYNTYIRPYTLSYIISASLQNVSDIVADVCVRAAESNTNGCQRLLGEAHCRMFLVSQQSGLVLVDFMLSRILTV